MLRVLQKSLWLVLQQNLSSNNKCLIKNEGKNINI